MNLIPGSYEAILTHHLQEALQGLDGSWSHQLDKLESAEAADRLALHLSRVIEKVLAAMPSDQRVTAGSKLVGELIVQALQGRRESLSGEVPSQAGELLMQVARRLSEPPSRDADADHLETEPSFASGFVHGVPGRCSLKRRPGLCMTCLRERLREILHNPLISMSCL